jgi:hypothetical protein
MISKRYGLDDRIKLQLIRFATENNKSKVKKDTTDQDLLDLVSVSLIHNS